MKRSNVARRGQDLKYKSSSLNYWQRGRRRPNHCTCGLSVVKQREPSNVYATRL